MQLEKNEILFKANNPSLSLMCNSKTMRNCKCTFLRSASHWSIGLNWKFTESSIMKEYISLIQNSEKFIYIENQYFISNTGMGDSVIDNKYVYLE